VEYAYYQYDSNYLYLKFKCYAVPGSEWPGKGGRYKWFIDLEGNMYYSGGNIFDSEYLLFVEDTDGDGSGEQFLLFDINNDGNYGEYEPWPPTNYASYMITDPSVGGFRIVAVNQIEMYISWASISDPSSYWLAWATDQQNPNLDQGPTTDRWDEEQPLVLHDVAAVNQTVSPTVVTQGQVVSIDVFVENQGTQSETFNVTCYCDSGVVGTQLVTNLPAGHSTTLNLLWNTTGVPPGNYVIRSWADSGGVITEMDEVDNWCTAPAAVTVKIHDVAAISQVPNATEVLRGGKVSIDVTVKNQGNFTETFDVTCYYDSNTIGTQLVSSLAPGVSTVKTFYWDTTGVANGTYHIRGWADSGNVILETDETNNNCTSFVTVTVYSVGPGALLVDKAQTAVISGPDPPVVGFTTVYELTILVTNPGGSTVTNVVVNDTTSSNVTFVSVGVPSQGSITATPPPKIVWNVGSLNAGANATLTFRVSVTPTAPGLLYLNHKEHLTASGIDSSTGNPVSDTGDTDVTVVAIARDVAAISQVPSSAIVLQGDSVAIYVTVQNQGTQSETFNVTCYYSDGLTDTLIGRLRVYSLSAGNSTMLTFDWNTIGVAPGIYNIKAWADSGMEIAEGDETDNWCTAPAAVEIVIHDVAAISQTPTPTTVTQGGTVTINVVVENQGSKSETFQVSCYYDNNPIGSPQTVTNLAPSTSTPVVFIWNTAGVTPGTYYIYAVASTVLGEKDTNDNACYSVDTVTVLTLQHLVVFTHTGLTTDATGVVVTVNGSGKIFMELPFNLFVDHGTVVSYSYTSTVPSSVSGKRFILTSVTGPSSPINVTSAVTVTGNYKTQYKITVTATPSGAIGGIFRVAYTSCGITYSNVEKTTEWTEWVDKDTTVAVSSPQQFIPSEAGVGGMRHKFDSYSPSASVTMTEPKTIILVYKTQYYLTVTSPYDSPTPTSGWFNAETPIIASVTSPWPGSIGTRYVCTGWIGTGSVPTSGTTATVSFTINAPSSITWNWKTQYLLTVRTDPTGLSPQPTRNVTGEAGPPGSWWYDSSANVLLTAQPVTGYTFLNWDVDGTNVTGNPISVHMGLPHTATAHYRMPPPPPPPACVGGEMILFKVDKPSMQGIQCQVESLALFSAATVVSIVFIRRKKRRQ